VQSRYSGALGRKEVLVSVEEKWKMEENRRRKGHKGRPKARMTRESIELEDGIVTVYEEKDIGGET
jgi:hypothetical protein